MRHYASARTVEEYFEEVFGLDFATTYEESDGRRLELIRTIDLRSAEGRECMQTISSAKLLVKELREYWLDRELYELAIAVCKLLYAKVYA